MPTITPGLRARFDAYHAAHPMWGPLHVVMEDGNVTTRDVAYCIAEALSAGDVEGMALATILYQMSRTQRRKLAGV